MKEWKYLINGKLVEGKAKKFTVYNPATAKPIAEIPGVSAEQAEEALENAQKAFEKWSKMSLAKREKYILKFSEVLEENRDKVIDVLIQETGKPLENATYDFQMLVDCLHFFIEEAKRLEGNIIPDYEGEHINMIIRKPVGVVVGYLAWNFPLLNLGYKLGPALAAGCTCILKPSSQTPLASMYVGELAKEAGIPDGVINIVVDSDSSLYSVLSGSSITKMITLIGSSATGRRVIEQSANSLKHYSLELGGNAPVMVMKDADVKNAAVNTTEGKFSNVGQVCVAPNRVFVHKDVKDEFMKYVKEVTARITLGSGRDEGDILMGPLVSKRARDYMQELVDDAVSKGAVVVCGGKKADREGYFFEPTVLDNVTPEMRVYKEEIFGPIMPVITFDDSADPVELANDTIYGLAAYLYTEDLKTAMHVSKEIDSGSVCVNEPFYNYNLPHGGCKESGIGKDCSRFSLEEYYYIQRITVRL